MAWNYFNQFNTFTNRHLPDYGEGDSMGTQVVTAVCKLIYKWYNDGDVYDNVNSGMSGWANDLSSYANWLYTNAPYCDEILTGIFTCHYDEAYEVILEQLADLTLNEKYCGELFTVPTVGTIYNCDGPFQFYDNVFAEDEEYEDEEYEDEEYEW